MKECPFCGSKEITPHDSPSQAGEKTLWKMYCFECHARGPIKYTREDAESAWDNRPICKHEKVIVVAHSHMCVECEKVIE